MTTASWHAHRVLVCDGQPDTHVDSGEQYRTLTLAEIFALEPTNLPKLHGPAMIPSEYCAADGRRHEAQRERGRFVALTGDIDCGNHSIERVRDFVENAAPACAWAIYSSPHARADDKRWRVILPLSETCAFEVWRDAQIAFHDLAERAGLAMDRTLARAGQLVFLPNVPDKHAKTGAALRDDTGKPLYYTALCENDRPGVAFDTGPLASEVDAVRMRRAAEDRLREKMRAEADARRASRSVGLDASTIDAFNRRHPIADLLAEYGYEQSPRDDRDWRSPHQSSDSYATRVIGEKWVSLSGSDASAGVGSPCQSGCYGDAYDLFVAYEHEGDQRSAWGALCVMRDYGQLQVSIHDSGTGPYRGLDLASLDGAELPDRQFVVPQIAPAGEVTLFTGPGSAGKSLLGQQICTALAAGKPTLGWEMSQAPAIYLTCEDSDDELRRRQRSICRMLDVAPASLTGTLTLVSLRGQLGNELGTFDKNGRLAPTPAFNRLVSTINAARAKLVCLDNVGHLFVGNENDRGEVTRFINLLNRLAGETGAAVMLIGHPPKASGAGAVHEYSGSTAWLNAVRSQFFIEHDRDNDMRTLRLGKANYARTGDVAQFFWRDWAFVRLVDMTKEDSREATRAVQASKDDELFIECLRERTKQQRAVSDRRSASFAPTEFAKMPESKRIGRDRLEAAMNRLFAKGSIERAELWKGADRHRVFGLRETAGDGAGNSARETRDTIAKPAENLAADAGGTHTILSYTGAALEAAHASVDPVEHYEAEGHDLL